MYHVSEMVYDDANHVEKHLVRVRDSGKGPTKSTPTVSMVGLEQQAG